GEEGGVPVTLEYGVVDGQLLVGVNDGIDNYLNGSGSSLADDPVYQQTMDALPQEHIIGIQFLNIEQLIPLVEDVVGTFSMDMMDADEACGDYATQEEAQAAYDADPEGMWMLDQNHAGVACEDYFTADASPGASPEAESLNILAAGTVGHVDGDLYRTNSVLLIGD